MVKSYINKKLKSNSFESKEPTQEHLGKNKTNIKKSENLRFQIKII
jgi:hypothetical protein